MSERQGSESFILRYIILPNVINQAAVVGVYTDDRISIDDIAKLISSLLTT